MISWRPPLSSTTHLPLARAEALAKQLVARMQPWCQRIEVAGSIRRRRPVVGDIDLVILSDRAEDLRAHCASKWSEVSSGPQNAIYQTRLWDGSIVQIDMFFAQPESSDLFTRSPTNFGSLLICRTGSKEHNIKLVEWAKRLGLRWNPYRGVFRGDNLIASATEEEVFAALELSWQPPEGREA